MSIAITLLGHSPRKKDGYSSGTGGAGIAGFLHLAYANSEEGEGFTKTNINEDGHIAFYPYIGMCISEDRDDDNLSFHSYEWSNVGYGDTSSQEGGTPNGTGNNSSGGNGNNTGCSCETCCNYQYCGGDDPSGIDQLAVLNPQIVDYDVPECIHPSEGYVMNTSDHLLFDDEVRSVGYSVEGEAGAKSITWHVWLKCHTFKIKIEKALDIYQGWIYYADILNFNPEIMSVYVNLNQKLTKESGYTIPEDPQWHGLNFDSTPVLKMNNSVAVNATSIEDNIAKWNQSVIESIFGQSRTDRLHECHNEGLGYYSVYDTTIKYRWKAGSYEDLIAILPKLYTINYGSLMRVINFEYTGEAGSISKINLVNSKINSSPYYDTTSANKQGARLDTNHPAYTGWENDWYEVDNSNYDSDVEYKTWVRFYNGYDMSWLNTMYQAGTSASAISYVEPTATDGQNQVSGEYTYVTITSSNISTYESKTGGTWTWERTNINPISNISAAVIENYGTYFILRLGLYFVKEDSRGNLQNIGTVKVAAPNHPEFISPVLDYNNKVSCAWFEGEQYNQSIDSYFGSGTLQSGKVIVDIKEDGKTIMTKSIRIV